MREKLEYILKHYMWVQNLYKVTMSFVFKFIGLFVKTDENLILYNSYMGHTRFDSPMAIYKYILSHPEYAGLKHVWAFSDPEHAQLEGCEKIKMDTLKYFITALKAKYWVTNVNIERGLHFKKKNTIYLNTWHGTSLNTVGNDVPGRNDYNFTNVNYLCYESEFNKKILMRVLRAKEESMIPTGLPRNDELYYVTDNEIVELKKRLGLPLDKKLILYAPTWRESVDNGKSYQLAPPINFKYWEEKLGKDYIVLLRTHHITTDIMNVEFNDFVRNFTAYPKINDLFKVSDMLISDYSACITDYSILSRPILCFAYDYDWYRQTRGLNLDFRKEMPSGVLDTEQDVVNHILTMNYEEECQKTKEFNGKYTYIGGHATEICVEKLFEHRKKIQK